MSNPVRHGLKLPAERYWITEALGLLRRDLRLIGFGRLTSALSLSPSSHDAEDDQVGDDPALRRRLRQLELCHALSRRAAGGGRLHRPDDAQVDHARSPSDARLLLP